MENNNHQSQNSHSELRATTSMRRRVIRSLKQEQDEKRSLPEKIADWMTAAFGSVTFLVINILWFTIWIMINTGLIPGVRPFDEFPFGLLTMIVSLEAIILAIFVLISQNRAAKVADLREEIDLQVDILTEEEITKLMHMVSLLLEKQGIDISGDSELQEMLKPADMRSIEKTLSKQTLGK
jgi:uncharacterized membrane protein